jgi:tetratricopeptide (TPR) repeat protein
MPLVALAELRLLEGKNSEAELAARKAIASDPNFDRGYTMLGVVLIKGGSPELGFAELRKGVEVGGRENNGRGYLRAKLFLANEFYDTGQYNDALFEYGEILKLDADQTTANLNLGAVYLRNGRYDDALPLLKRAAEADDTAALNNLGALYSNIDQCQEAVKVYSRAVAIDPKLPSPLHGLGDCYQRLGDLQNARRWYELAIERYDETLAQMPSASTLSRRAFCAARLGRKAEALTDVDRAVRQAKPDDGDVFLTAAAVYGITGPHEMFYTYVRKALENGTSLAEFRRDLSFRDFRDDPQFRSILDDPPPKGGRSGQSAPALPSP